MAGMGLVRRLWLTRLSKPAAERLLYRHVLTARPRGILEIGLGMLGRTERLLQAVAGSEPIRYVGIDRFEGRSPSDPPGVTLKTAHKRLHGLGRVQLVPGNADAALARLCNHLGTFDLVLVAADNDPRHLERSWFFIQRLMSSATTVLVETAVPGAADGVVWKRIDKRCVDDLAARTIQRRAA